jgi:nucleoside-diphosphate-sugar epimerase
MARPRPGRGAGEASGLDWTIVRPPAVYGPRDTDMFEMFRTARGACAAAAGRGEFDDPRR